MACTNLIALPMSSLNTKLHSSIDTYAMRADLAFDRHDAAERFEESVLEFKRMVRDFYTGRKPAYERPTGKPNTEYSAGIMYELTARDKESTLFLQLTLPAYPVEGNRLRDFLQDISWQHQRVNAIMQLPAGKVSLEGSYSDTELATASDMLQRFSNRCIQHLPFYYRLS